MNETWEQYTKLRDRVLDGRANQDDIDHFERLVLNSEAMKRDYTEHAHQQAALIWRISDAPQSTAETFVHKETKETNTRKNRGGLVFPFAGIRRSAHTRGNLVV